MPPVGPAHSYSVTTGPSTPYSGTQQETFDPSDTLDLARDGGSLFADARPFAPRPTGSTGNFLFVGQQGLGRATIDFAQAVHYYGFLWGSPNPNPADPSQRQGVELYSGAELVAVHSADSLGLDGDTRFVNFHAAQDKPFTRAVLFTQTGFETDNHAVYAVAPAQAPTVSAPASIGFTEDSAGAVVFGATPFADPDSTQLAVTLEVADGALGAVGAVGVTVGGTAERRTFSGTVADLNAYFTTAGNISYTPSADANGSRTLTTSVSDGALSASADTLLQIAAVNDAPVLALPAAQTVDENDALVFSPANGNAVSVSDVDAGLSEIELQLGVSNGTLRLSGVAGLTLVAGADGSSAMTWRGSAASINAALAGLQYTPSRDFNGSATLTLATSDLGNTGAGGARTDTGSVAITVNPRDSAPSVSAPPSFRVTEDRLSPLVFTGTPFADADSSILTVTLEVADGTLVGSSGNGITQGGTPTARTFTGTAANLNAYFTRAGSLAYMTGPNNTDTRTLGITASDGTLSTQATSLILIDPEPVTPPLPRPPAPVPGSSAGTPRAQPTGSMAFERSAGPVSADTTRPTETFEPDVVRTLEVAGGLAIGPVAGRSLPSGPPVDPANHSMVVGSVPGAPQAERMTVDLSTRATASLGFDWGRAKAGQSVELYSGPRLLGRYDASEVFADAPERTAPSGYVTFRSLDGAPITRAVFSAAGSSPFEVDNLSTDPTSAAAADSAASAAARPLHVRLGLYGQAAMRGEPAVGAGPGGATPTAGAGSGSIASGGRPVPVVVPPLPQRRVLDLYGRIPATQAAVVLRQEEIESRARLTSAYAMLAPGSAVDRKELERAYGMRL